MKLAQSSLLRPEAMHSHLLAVAALCAVLQGDFASDDVVAAALVTSMKSICDTASPSTLTNAHGIEVLLNTLAQLHQSLEQLLGRAGRQ